MQELGHRLTKIQYNRGKSVISLTQENPSCWYRLLLCDIMCDLLLSLWMAERHTERNREGKREERENEREREISIHCFILQVCTTGTRPDGRQEPGTPSVSLKCVAKNQLLEPSRAAWAITSCLPGCTLAGNWHQEQSWDLNLRHPIWGPGVPSCALISGHMPSLPCFLMLRPLRGGGCGAYCSQWCL